MSDQATRAQRARQGSNRKRDREALKAVEAPPPIPPDTAPSPAAVEAWAMATAQILTEIPEPTFACWFAQLEVAGESGGALVLEGPEHAVSWLRFRYRGLIGRSVRELTDFTGAFVGVNERNG